jgi:SAM-dependent methyltransferase
MTRGSACLLLTALVITSARADEEVPFITTPDHVTLAMLELAAVKPGDFVIDLGSGDGRIVITAAKRMGAKGLGVEIVPELVERSRSSAERAGVADKVSFRQQDLFDTPLGGASVVTMYLLPELNMKLRPRLLALAPGTRIVSHDWDMGDWQPERTITLDVPDKVVGREKKSRVHLWVVPARVQGLWCAKGMSLHIEQRFQRYSASFESLSPPASAQPLLVQDGVVDADGITLHPVGMLPGVVMRFVDESLRVERPAGALEVGTRFMRAVSGGCA